MRLKFWGVLQGSIIWPLIFIKLINNNNIKIEIHKIVLYDNGNGRFYAEETTRKTENILSQNLAGSMKKHI